MFGRWGVTPTLSPYSCCGTRTQVETISTSIAATSTVTDSAAAVSSVGSQDSISESSLEMSLEDGGEEEEPDQPDGVAGDVTDDGPEVPSGHSPPAETKDSGVGDKPVPPLSERVDTNDTTRGASGGETDAGGSAGGEGATGGPPALPQDDDATSW